MRWRRSGGIAGIVVLGLILLTLVTARSGDPKLYPARHGDQQEVWLIDNGFHTDLALPRTAIMARGGPLAAAAAQTSADPWIMVGWGDGKFYETETPWQGRIGDAVRAALGGRPTTVHLEGVWTRPDQAWRSRVHRIPVSGAGMTAIIARVNRSLVVDRSGAPVALPAPRQPGEAFFASRDRFNVFDDCNQWTAGLLSSAGLPTTPTLDSVPASLWLDLQLRSRL